MRILFVQDENTCFLHKQLWLENRRGVLLGLHAHGALSERDNLELKQQVSGE